jgi:colanic acid/amylovoran biosynthesis glycosyltransferase
MEAMALNRPVISTRIAGIPELLDETCGWIIAPDDVQPLTDALADCAAAPADRLRAMGAEGRARVTARHDQTQTAAELRALIGQGG